MKRLPVAPLLRISGCDEAAALSEGGNGTESTPDTVLAQRLGYRNVRDMARTLDWYRMKREGLTYIRADQFACALGFHPLEIWGDDWLDAQEGDQRGDNGRLLPLRREPRWGLIAAELSA